MQPNTLQFSLSHAIMNTLVIQLRLQFATRQQSFVTTETQKKGRGRSCRKMFLEPDVPPSRKHTSVVQDVIRLHVYAMRVSSKAMCFLTVILSLNTSVPNVRKLLLKGKRTSQYSN